MKNEIWPSFKYHKQLGAKLFKSKEEFEAAGPGWVDSPANFDSEQKPELKPAEVKSGEHDNLSHDAEALPSEIEEPKSKKKRRF